MRRRVVDWEECFNDGLIPKLVELRDHIAEHQLVEGWEEQVQEMNGALDLWHIWNDELWGNDLPMSWEVEDDVFDAFMDYLKYHIRKWWD